MDPITLLPDKHRFFNQLATAQAVVGAYALLSLRHTLLDVNKEARIAHSCFTIHEQLEFNILEALEPIIARQDWPPAIHLDFSPLEPTRPTSAPLLIHPGIFLLSSVYQHAFVTYFEKSIAGMIATHGDKRCNWPNVLIFGRIVRNAFAHGGTVHITDGLSATWGGVHYSEAENGRRVCPNDLSEGDLTLLMIDMDPQF